MDIAVYGLSLNQSIIITKIGYGGGSTVFEKVSSLIVGNIIVVLAGNLPGYWLSIALIEVLGRRGLQLIGSILLTIIYVIFSTGYDAILDASIGAFIFLYALAYLFINAGPNTTTFIIAVEIYHTHVVQIYTVAMLLRLRCRVRARLSHLEHIALYMPIFCPQRHIRADNELAVVVRSLYVGHSVFIIILSYIASSYELA
ncbi:hypothetical protein Unana1_07896 [Umbelopsis nana]